MTDTIKVIITDDQTLFREGLNMILGNDPAIEIVAEAASGEQLLQLLPEIQPDVILLDYTMPGLDGYETFLQVQRDYPDIRVLILTMHYDESLMVFLMEKGVNGYLLKDEESATLVAAIKTVHREGQYFSTYVSKAILNQLKTAGQNQLARQQAQKGKQFSQRETEILELVGQCSRKEMAEQLFISIKTVDFHLKNLRDKTGASSSSELVSFAIKNGFQT